MGRISVWLNNIAALSLFVTMVLVVGNILLRVLFNNPIKVTYDFVGFFTAIAIGLALAYCAFEDGHISINILMQRFPKWLQKGIDVIIGLISVILILVVAYYVAQYAYTISLRGEVGLSSGVPHAPFIYLIALGLGLMGLVVLGKLLSLLSNGGRQG